MDSHPAHDPSIEPVQLTHNQVTLAGSLAMAAQPRGVVLFAHGVGGNRYSPTSRFVAAWQREAGFATLQLDLLTAHEARLDEKTQYLCFDSRRLSERLIAATDWLARHPRTAGLAIAYFGTGTGAGAALVAAGQRAARVGAVAWCAGRPDLAGEALGLVRAPTLLLVDEGDVTMQTLNRHAMRRMHTDVQLSLVPGAMPPFRGAGVLRRLAQLSTAWFEQKLPADDPVPEAEEAAEGPSAAHAPECIQSMG